MRMFVVYECPRDYPGRFVVREWLIGPGEMTPVAEPAIIAESLEAARGVIPSWLERLPRFPDDDPTVCEVWL